LLAGKFKDVDARGKPGHDVERCFVVLTQGARAFSIASSASRLATSR